MAKHPKKLGVAEVEIREEIREVKEVLVEKKQKKVVLKVSLLQFRRSFSEIIKKLRRQEVDGVELNYRGKAVAYVTPLGERLLPPSPPPPPPPPLKKLKAGKVTL